MMSRAVGSFSELDFDGFEVRRVPSRPSAIGVTRVRRGGDGALGDGVGCGGPPHISYHSQGSGTRLAREQNMRIKEHKFTQLYSTRDAERTRMAHSEGTICSGGATARTHSYTLYTDWTGDNHTDCITDYTGRRRTLGLLGAVCSHVPRRHWRLTSQPGLRLAGVVG